MDTSPEYIRMCAKAIEIQRLKPKPVTEKDFLYLYGGDVEGDLKTKKVTWLPRQDQLQEMMVREPSETPFDASMHLFYYLTDFRRPSGHHGLVDYWEGLQQKGSFEILLLAAIMKDRFNKIWVSGEWKEHMHEDFVG